MDTKKENLEKVRLAGEAASEDRAKKEKAAEEKWLKGKRSSSEQSIMDASKR